MPVNAVPQLQLTYSRGFSIDSVDRSHTKFLQRNVTRVEILLRKKIELQGGVAACAALKTDRSTKTIHNCSLF